MAITLLSVLLGHSVAATADVQYEYDSVGRLRQVVAPDGNVAQYNYDSSGNIVGILRPGANTLSISTFSPSRGFAGTVVRISGSGFSPTSAENTVHINGVNAVVSSASATSLTVTVPISATTGLISVSNTLGSAISSSPFIIKPLLTITGFSPTEGDRGALVAIAGTGFEPDAHNNLVLFGGIPAEVTSASTTQLQASVPPTARSGPIGVRNASGYALSAAEFFVPPSTIPLASVLSKPLLAVGGAYQNINISQAHKYVLIRFNVDATPGYYSFQFSNLSLSDTTAVYGTLWGPDGNNIWGVGIDPATLSAQFPALTVQGNYVFSLTAWDGTASLSAKVEKDEDAILDAPDLVASVEAAHSKRYVFTGAIGDGVGLAFSNLTSNPSNTTFKAQIKDPDRTIIKTCTLYASSSPSGGPCFFDPLKKTGAYTLQLSASPSTSVEYTMALMKNITGVLVANEPALTFTPLRLGQRGRYSFNASANNNYLILVSADTILGDSGVAVYDQTGLHLNSGGTSYSSGPGKEFIVDLGSINATGAYSAVVTPYTSGTGSLSIKLSQDVSGSLLVDGANTDIAQTAGQGGTYSFEATAGSNLGLGLSNLAFSPSSGTFVKLQVDKPDGSILACCPTFNTASTWDLPTLPATGTYQLRLVPSKIATTSSSLTLSSDFAGTLTANGSALNFTTSRPGQNARYSTQLSAGQSYTLLLSADTFVGSTNIQILKPNGSQLTSTSLTYTSGVGASKSLNLLNIPESGTYTVFISPAGAGSGAITTKLTQDLMGNIAVDGSVSTAALAAGQSASYSFDGIAGQKLGLGLSSATVSPSGSLAVSIYKPNGSVLDSCSVTASGGSCDLTVLPSTGTYSIRIVPPATSTAGFTLTLSTDVVGAIAVNGSASNFSTTRVGQNARFTFSATAGQSYTLRLTGDVFPGSTAIYVYKPNGALWTSTSISYTSGAGSSANRALSNATSTGTYTVFISPSGIATGQINVGVSQP